MPMGMAVDQARNYQSLSSINDCSIPGRGDPRRPDGFRNLPWLIRISAAGAVDVSVSRTLPLVMRVNDIADFRFGSRQN
ncbi:MAG: hypothetical protein Ct9H300mP16_17520 [Pseudomonadota bacterium]|nr:MAG: hypothetical protein Ct9H300mP16_17520 [Pseudomonadota bacterium]